jgi:hypothetical protein
VKAALDDRVAEHALEVALGDLRGRIEAAEPRRLEGELAELDTKIQRAVDLAIDLGDLPEARERLKTLRDQRERLVHELAAVKLELPMIDELMPRLREKLQELESTIMADVPRGRLALGGLLDGERLRIYADGRMDGTATLAPETLHPPKRGAPGGPDHVVAGEGFEPPTSGL